MRVKFGERGQEGFTLIELIIVVAILAVLAGIGVPKYQSIKAGAVVKADAVTAASIVKAARIQEVETGERVTTLTGTTGVVLDDTYMDGSVAPQSGGEFVLSGGEDEPYMISWTPGIKFYPYSDAQKVTEGKPFEIDDKPSTTP